MVLRAIGDSETMYILISIFKVVQFRSIYSLYVNSILNRFGIDLMLYGDSVPFFLFWRGFDLISRHHERLGRKEGKKNQMNIGGAVAPLEKIYTGFRKLHRNDRAMLALPRV